MKPLSRSTPRRIHQGAALLLALLVTALVATLVSGMVWQQRWAVGTEITMRHQTQSQWLLRGAFDWGRLILREDAREGGSDHLGEPWATPLAPARLSSFLAAGQNSDDLELNAWVSGHIEDAQAKFNLRNLQVGGTSPPPEDALAIATRLLNAAGVPEDQAMEVCLSLQRAWSPTTNAPTRLAPHRLSDLRWFGLDDAVLDRLQDSLTLLPRTSTVNVNTAPVQVLIAVLGPSQTELADRIIQERQRQPFKHMEELKSRLGIQSLPQTSWLSANSQFFEIHAQLRLETERSGWVGLVERRGLDMVTLWQANRTPAQAVPRP